MPGPPPTPTHLRLLKGNPGKRPIRPEPQPAVSEQAPAPPDFLDGYALDEWHRLADELHRLRLLSALDVMPFSAYCVVYRRWRQAEEGLRDPENGGLVVERVDGNTVQNPLLKIASNAAKDMLNYAREFGLTPVARARIANGPGWQPPGGGKFDGLIGG